MNVQIEILKITGDNPSTPHENNKGGYMITLIIFLGIIAIGIIAYLGMKATGAL